MEHTVKKIKSLLDEAQVKYTTTMRKKDLTELLSRNVDSRYHLFAMSTKQLRAELYAIDEPQIGKKATLLERIWNKKTNDTITEEADTPLYREPISDFPRMKTAEELTSEYKAFTGEVDIPKTLDNIEDLSDAVSKLSCRKFLDDVFEKKLDPDTLSVIVSFLPQNIDDQTTRMEMIEDAEQYGSYHNIELIIQTLKQMQFYNEAPEYIDGNSKKLRRSQLFLRHKRKGFPSNFAKTFAKYYNTYIRGDTRRYKGAYDDLERKLILCMSSAHELEGNLHSEWERILNYDGLIMACRMRKLNKLRPELDTTAHNRIDMNRLLDLIWWGSNLRRRVTQDDRDNVALLGTYDEIKIMTLMIHDAYETFQFPNAVPTIEQLEELLRRGAYERDYIGNLHFKPFPGGNYRKAMVQLYGFMSNEMVLHNPNGAWIISNLLNACLAVAQTGIQSQWKMTHYELD